MVFGILLFGLKTHWENGASAETYISLMGKAAIWKWVEYRTIIFHEKERIFTNQKNKDEGKDNTHIYIDDCIAPNNVHLPLFGQRMFFPWALNAK